MDSESRFFALEVMCLERARLADEEASYWLAEADEWARFRLKHVREKSRESKCLLNGNDTVGME